MNEPAYLFQERVGPWHEKYAWRPVRLHDGFWIWRQKYRSALYQSKAHLSGPTFRTRVNDLIPQTTSAPAYDASNDIRQATIKECHDYLTSWVRNDVEADVIKDAVTDLAADIGSERFEQEWLTTRDWMEKVSALQTELAERCDQVDKLQQEQDELNVALSGVVRSQIRSQQSRLEAIQVLKRRAE